MEAVQKISRADLPREAQRVLDAVHHGEAAVIGRNGEPEAAILDIVDYRILRAVAHYQSHSRTIEDPEAGLSDETVADLAEIQAQYDLVIGYYLADATRSAAPQSCWTWHSLTSAAASTGWMCLCASARQRLREALEDAAVAGQIARSVCG